MSVDGVGMQIAKLQSDVEHVRVDISEMKIDIRRLDDKTDALRDSLHSTKIWALLLYFAQSAVLLGVMARGFGWLN